MSKELECPYCEHEFDINHDDGFGYKEDITEEIQCPECEKYFVFTASITWHYEAYKADCLNGSEHDYQLTRTIPKAFSKMRCTMCDKERELTEDERVRYCIPTKDEYTKSLKSN